MLTLEKSEWISLQVLRSISLFLCLFAPFDLPSIYAMALLKNTKSSCLECLLVARMNKVYYWVVRHSPTVWVITTMQWWWPVSLVCFTSNIRCKLITGNYNELHVHGNALTTLTLPDPNSLETESPMLCFLAQLTWRLVPCFLTDSTSRETKSDAIFSGPSNIRIPPCFLSPKYCGNWQCSECSLAVVGR